MNSWNKHLIKLLTEHPDATIKCFESSFAGTEEEYATLREVSYRADTNTIILYYYSI